MPHEVNEKSINESIERVRSHNLSCDVYTNSKINFESTVLIINTTGILSKIYYYANCAYIGGGFNSGLHNTIEPAVYGIPIAFYGQDYTKYNEAVDLVNLGVATAVNDSAELTTAFSTFLSNDFNINQLSNKLDTYFKSNSNTTSKILNSLKL